MEKLRAPFDVEVSDTDETIPDDIQAEAAAQYLSRIKADAVFGLHRSEAVTVVGADTVVLHDGIIYGKPKDADDAYRMLRSLSGRTHKVITGVAIITGNGEIRRETSFSDVSNVTFYELTDREIWDYIATGEPMDKAGAYGIQQLGALLVKHIDGDFYSVMGLPIARTARELAKLLKLKQGDISRR